MRQWKGSVYPRGSKLWLHFKLDGKWVDRPTAFRVGQEAVAEKLLARMREKLQAGEDIEAELGGPVTVRIYGKRWVEKRRSLGIDNADDEEGHFEHHINPAIGEMRLDEVQARHLVALVEKLRLAGKATRTVRNIYSTVRSMFRDATIEGLVSQTPAILTKHQIGKVRDKDPTWRDGAQFTKDELRALVFDSRLPEDRRVLYGVLGVAGLRHGEMAGLRIKNVHLDLKPLGRLRVVESYDKGRTKTEVPRLVPVHPTLAPLLADWLFGGGWEAAMGRLPGPDDLVFPVPPSKGKGPRRTPGSMRDKCYTYKRLQADLALLGLRRRRLHDLRRTFITLARNDGADRDVLRWASHGRSKDIMDQYTTVEWERLCAEVAKLRLPAGAPAPAPLPARAT